MDIKSRIILNVILQKKYLVAPGYLVSQISDVTQASCIPHIFYTPHDKQSSDKLCN